VYRVEVVGKIDVGGLGRLVRGVGHVMPRRRHRSAGLQQPRD